ncbi:MAG: glycosyltransferase family 4 protein [Actinomycetota bacterium]
MRIAFHVDQLWFSAPGGIGTYVSHLASELPAVAPDDELVPFSASWAGRPSPEGVPAATRSVGMPIRALYPMWAWSRRPNLPQRFGTLDAIHATNPAAIPPARPGQALVVTIHDLAFERYPELYPPRWRRLYQRGLEIAVREAHAVLAPSRHAAAAVAAHGVERERIHITPLAADPPAEAGTASTPPYDGPYVLFVGTLEPRKNLPRLVRAFRAAVGDASLPHQLILAGPTGWQQDTLANALAADGGGRVHLPGRVGRQELEALYRGADAVAYPSLYEGFGLPVLEALAHGRPTLTSSTSSIPEVADDAALLVDPEDDDAIAAGLVRILTDEPLRAELMSKGPARAASFSWAATARATLEAYRDALERVGR